MENIKMIELIKTCRKIKCKILIDEAYYGFCKQTFKKLVKKI